MAGRRDIQAGKAYVEMYVKNKRLIRGLQKAQARLRAFGESARMIGVQMLASSAAMLAPFALAAKVFLGFSDQMLLLKGVTQATTEEYKKLYAVIKKLGRERPFMASEIAGMAVQLGRAGFNSAEIEAALDPVINLARATGTDLPKATEIAADSLRAFMLPATKMGYVTDVLTVAANNSAQSLEVLGDSMKYMAQVGVDANQSLKDTALAAGILATLGLKGSMAGTGYRRMTLALAEPKTAVELKKLGVEINHIVDGEKKIRPLVDIFTDLGKATAGMDSLKRLNLFRDLFDLRAMGAGLKLTRANAAMFDKLMKSMENLDGAARKTADVMESGLGGVWRVLRAGAEGLGIAIGEVLEKELKALGKEVTLIVSVFTKWIETNKAALITFIKVAAGIGLMGAALLALGTAAAFAAAGMALLTPFILGLGALAIGITALAVAYANAKIHGITFGESVLDLTHKITGLSNAYSKLLEIQDRESKGSNRARVVEEGLKSGDAAQVEAGIKALETEKSRLESQIDALQKEHTRKLQYGVVRPRGFSFGPSDSGPSKGLEEYDAGFGDSYAPIKKYQELAATLKLATLELKRFKEEQRGLNESLAAAEPSMIANMAKIGTSAGKAFVNSIVEQLAALKPLMHQLNVTMAEGIADPQKREERLAKLRHKTQQGDAQKQIKEGKAGPASLPVLEMVQQQELANIRERYARIAVEAQKHHETQVAYDTERLQIEKTMRGAEREKALLSLRQRHEREAAAAAGLDTASLEKKFALQRKLPTTTAIKKTPVGTFSAAASRLMGGGGNIPQRQLKVAEKQLKKAEELIKLDKNLIREVRRGRLVYIA